MKKLILLITLALLTKSSIAAVSKAEFEELKLALKQAYSELAPSTNDILKINLPIPGLSEDYWWDIEMVHASYVKFDNDEGQTEHRIYLMGGFARLAEMTPDGLALTACHEMGHGIGGGPYKESGSTQEGQADYYATKICLPIVFKYLPQMREISFHPTYEKLCAKQDEHDSATCLRLMTAMEADQAFFKSQGQETSFDHFSTHIQTEINNSPSFYPDAQCRMDTMINGILGLERPVCWYPQGIPNGTLRD